MSLGSTTSWTRWRDERPVVAGTLVTASLVTDLSPFLKWTLAAIAGGGMAGLVHGTTSLARGASTLSTGGLANPFLATAELGGAVLTSLMADPGAGVGSFAGAGGGGVVVLASPRWSSIGPVPPARRVLLKSDQANQVAGHRDRDQLKTDGQQNLEGRLVLPQSHPQRNSNKKIPRVRRFATACERQSTSGRRTTPTAAISISRAPVSTRNGGHPSHSWAASGVLLHLCLLPAPRQSPLPQAVQVKRQMRLWLGIQATKKPGSTRGITLRAPADREQDDHPDHAGRDEVKGHHAVHDAGPANQPNRPQHHRQRSIPKLQVEHPRRSSGESQDSLFVFAVDAGPNSSYRGIRVERVENECPKIFTDPHRGRCPESARYSKKAAVSRTASTPPHRK